MATAKLYLNGVKNLNEGDIDWDTDTIKIGLYTSSYTPDQDAHDFRDDLGANEASGGSGYTAGGATIGSRSISVDAATNEIRLLGADVSWTITGGPLAFRYGVIYKSRGGASSADELIGYVDFGAQSVTDAVINVDFDGTNGIIKYTAA
jgi:hypothetical protein